MLVEKLVSKLGNQKSSLKSQKMAKHSVAMLLPYQGNSWQQLGYKGKNMLEGQYPSC